MAHRALLGASFRALRRAALAVIVVSVVLVAPRDAWAAKGGQTFAWSGEATADVALSSIRDDKNPDPKQHVYIDSESGYQANLKFFFQIAPNGSIEGIGKGVYTKLTWDLTGDNADNGHFDCSPPVAGQPFAVLVHGQALGRMLRVQLILRNAFEDNQDTDCGAHFTAYASHTTALIESFRRAFDQGQFVISEASPSVAPVDMTSTTTDGDVSRTFHDKWQLTLHHDCKGGDGTDPANSDYINQYDAGKAVPLPKGHADPRPGGNACGPSSLTMLVNANKAANGSSTFANLGDVYDSSMTEGHGGDGVDNNFDWLKGVATARGMGYIADYHDPSVPGSSEQTFIDSNLADGTPVLAGDTFSNGSGQGSGHVILITGRTPDGDYVVSDPAGDYQSGASHYGAGKCGDNVIYSKDVLESHIGGRPAIAISNVPGADPGYNVVIARRAGSGPPPLVVVTGDAGRRSGWLSAGHVVRQIPGSLAARDPVIPSEFAAAQPAVDPATFPYAVLLRRPRQPTLKVRVISQEPRGATPQHVKVEVFGTEGGQAVTRRLTAMTLPGGGTRSLRVDVHPPTARIATPRSGSRVRRSRLKRFMGTASDLNGIRAVKFSLQDLRTHRFLKRNGRAHLRRRRGRADVTWTIKAPPAILKGRRYRLTVAATDRAGNREPIHARGRNVALFTVH